MKAAKVGDRCHIDLTLDEVYLLQGILDSFSDGISQNRTTVYVKEFGFSNRLQALLERLEINPKERAQNELQT